MFADTALAARIESAKSRLSREAVHALQPREKDAFALEISGGVASFIRPGSRLNKVIGLAIREELTPEGLAPIEERYHERGEPVRVELSTLAHPDAGRFLTARGYRLMGFENVLGRDLSQATCPPKSEIEIARIDARQLPAWQETIVTGFACSDETEVVADSFTREIIAQATSDSVLIPGFERYLALRGGQPAGAASMRLVDLGIALLTGAATLAPYRSKGIQGALLARRLADARDHGAELAVITTSPGTRSQANAMRNGFHLLYSRAILVLEHGGRHGHVYPYAIMRSKHF